MDRAAVPPSETFCHGRVAFLDVSLTMTHASPTPELRRVSGVHDEWQSFALDCSSHGHSSRCGNRQDRRRLVAMRPCKTSVFKWCRSDWNNLSRTRYHK